MGSEFRIDYRYRWARLPLDPQLGCVAIHAPKIHWPLARCSSPGENLWCSYGRRCCTRKDRPKSSEPWWIRMPEPDDTGLAKYVFQRDADLRFPILDDRSSRGLPHWVETCHRGTSPSLVTYLFFISFHVRLWSGSEVTSIFLYITLNCIIQKLKFCKFEQ